MPGEVLPEECTRAGFPRAHRHKLCCLRQELVDAFVEHRYLLFMKLAALQLMQQKASKTENPTSLENGSPPPQSPSLKTLQHPRREARKRAAVPVAWLR